MRSKLILLTIASLLIAATLQADDLTILGHIQTDVVTVMPKQGINMNAVLAEFGQPDEQFGPVGIPPITEWVYGGFRVYFEHETVLHSINLNTIIVPK